jgi:glutamyl-tRNA reductase
MINLVCLGLNHRDAPVAVREKHWFSEEEVRQALVRLKASGVEECVLVSTCNRTELYYVPGPGGPGERETWACLASERDAAGDGSFAYVHAIHSVRAVQHLFKLASGIDSMVLGDVQIINQIKSAFALAQASRTSGTIMNKLFPAALHAGKRSRTETEIGDGAVSVGYAAAELASKIFQDLRTKTALLIGAGETGELTAQHLKSHGLGTLLVANRTRERAEGLASKMGGSVVDYGELESALAGVDIIISSVSAPTYVLGREVVERSRRRASSPLVIIDIGVPRNIDPALAHAAGVFLHDVDSLQQIIDRNLERRAAELPHVRDIVFQELLQFDRWHGSLALNPTIQQLRDQFESIRRAEVEKFSHHFRGELQDDVSMLTKRIVNKILHTPMVTLKGEPGKSDEVQKEIRMVRALFGLDA